MPRIEQVNEQLRAELSLLISEAAPLENGLITVTRVKCSGDLRSAAVYVSVLPENYNGTALKMLRKASGEFSARLKKRLKIKFIPRFDWKIDPTEEEADMLEKAIIEISQGSPDQ